MCKLSLYWLFTAVGIAGTINIGFDSPDYFPGKIKSNCDVRVALAAELEGTLTPHLLMPDSLNSFDSSWYFKSVIDALRDSAATAVSAGDDAWESYTPSYRLPDENPELLPAGRNSVRTPMS